MRPIVVKNDSNQRYETHRSKNGVQPNSINQPKSMQSPQNGETGAKGMAFTAQQPIDDKKEKK